MPHGITQCYLPPARGNCKSYLSAGIQLISEHGRHGRRHLRSSSYRTLFHAHVPLSVTEVLLLQGCTCGTVCRQLFERLLFCSLAVLGPRVGHTMDVLSPFISVLCRFDCLFHAESCLHLDVVQPGHAWSSSPACTWHCSLH